MYVTAYDVLFGRLVDQAGVDIVLVGDSLGNVVAGYDTTLPVTLDHMIYHGAAVCRGVTRALVTIDMPFLTYQIDVASALANAGRLIVETGAEAVKIEGGNERIAETVSRIVEIGIPVMGHLGFTPQSVNAIGVRVQGREAARRNACSRRRGDSTRRAHSQWCSSSFRPRSRNAFRKASAFRPSESALESVATVRFSFYRTCWA